MHKDVFDGNRWASPKSAVAALALVGALTLFFWIHSGSERASAHSTHYGVVTEGGCRVNPKKPIYQNKGGGNYWVWGVSFIGEGCTAHTTGVNTCIVYSYDYNDWIRSGCGTSVGVRQQPGQSNPAGFNCSWHNHWEFRSSVGIGLNNHGPTSYHRDADEYLAFTC